MEGKRKRLELPSVVVCDAGPLIHLDELNCLDLLLAYGDVLVPDAVWREVERHRPQALQRSELRPTRFDIISAPSAELQVLMRRYALDAGERQALALMQQFPEALVQLAPCNPLDTRETRHTLTSEQSFSFGAFERPNHGRILYRPTI